MSLTNCFNKNLDKVEVSLIRQFDQSISGVPGIMKSTLGEPDFIAPDHVKETAKAAIGANQSHYTGMTGSPALRQAATDSVRSKCNLSYNPDNEILVTVGAAEALSATSIVILEPGDTALLSALACPGYGPIANLVGAEIIEIDTTASDLVLTPETLEKAILEQGDKLKAVLLNYPANPTGVTYPRGQTKALAGALKKYDIFVISDEVHSELTYNGEPHVSIAEYPPEQTILINGLSKSHAMTGWRAGLTFTPAIFAAQLIKSHQYLVTVAATMAQFATIEALPAGKDDALPMRVEYIKRRNYIIDKMSALGFKIIKLDDTFYTFAKIPAGYEQGSLRFCQDFTRRKVVAFIPGVALGKYGEGCLRLSYAASMETTTAAMERLKEFMEERAN